MSYATDPVATTLRTVREAKGLSQRALASLAGVPQGHISKIENGAVDLRVSSLVGLARVLDLELMLVPRKSIPAVNSIIRSTASAPRQPAPATRKELRKLQRKLDKLLHKYPASIELAQFQRLARDLGNFIQLDADKLRHANRAVDLFVDTEDAEGLRRTLIEFNNMRNAAAHDAGSFPMTTRQRPAYSLEEDVRGE